MEQKLYDLKVRSTDHAEIISKLIEENYLNEERFAIQYAGGKFRMKQWGRRKIMLSLQQKGVSEYCIRKAMKEIGDADYKATIARLAGKKMSALKGETFAIRKKKTVDYMMGKGYEPSLVASVIGDPPKKKAR